MLHLPSTNDLASMAATAAAVNRIASPLAACCALSNKRERESWVRRSDNHSCCPHPYPSSYEKRGHSAGEW